MPAGNAEGEARLRWLDDPLRRVPREYSYSFPAADLYGFEREGVLNHLLNRKIGLYPEDMIEGFLLGVGEERISDEYQDRPQLKTRCPCTMNGEIGVIWT
jgi:hypothetical protein